MSKRTRFVKIKYKKRKTSELVRRIYQLVEESFEFHNNPYGADYSSTILEGTEYCSNDQGAKDLMDMCKKDENITIFDLIGLVVDYEKFNFGEVYTDIASAENVATMVQNVMTEHLVREAAHDELDGCWDRRMTDQEVRDVYYAIREYIKDRPYWWTDLGRMV